MWNSVLLMGTHLIYGETKIPKTYIWAMNSPLQLTTIIMLDTLYLLLAVASLSILLGLQTEMLKGDAKKATVMQ